jgi:RimJ/RimL family protein N-acetyltransferase
MIDFGLGVTLRTIEAENLPTLRAWRNDPKIWYWCRQYDAISIADQQAWFTKQSTDPTIRMYVVEAGNEIRGVCGLTSVDHVNRRAEFSLYIAPSHQKLGYAEKALKTLCLHGFRNLNLNCVWGESFEGNPAMAMFEKLGFKKEGGRREFYFRDGRFIPAYLYSLLARECSFGGVVDDAQKSAIATHPLDAAEGDFGTVSFYQAEGAKEAHRTV